MTASAEMPRFRSHKEVWALQISMVTPQADGGALLEFARGAGFAPRCVSNDLVARYMPAPLDYFVVYQDGYESISPRKAFEEGYIPVGSAEQLSGPTKQIVTANLAAGREKELRIEALRMADAHERAKGGGSTRDVRVRFVAYLKMLSGDAATSA